jgi:hypothetical protein
MRCNTNLQCARKDCQMQAKDQLCFSPHSQLPGVWAQVYVQCQLHGLLSQPSYQMLLSNNLCLQTHTFNRSQHQLHWSSIMAYNHIMLSSPQYNIKVASLHQSQGLTYNYRIERKSIWLEKHNDFQATDQPANRFFEIFHSLYRKFTPKRELGS